VRRRDVTAGLLLAAAAQSLRAQEPAKQRRIAIVIPAGPITSISDTGARAWQAFFEELRRLGIIEGQNLSVDRYSGEGRPAGYADLAREGSVALLRGGRPSRRRLYRLFPAPGSRAVRCRSGRTGRSRNALGAVPACRVPYQGVRFSAAFSPLTISSCPARSCPGLTRPVPIRVPCSARR
jgi:hypothetical protein